MVTRSWSANELFILYSISVLLPKHGIPKLAYGGNVLFVGLTSLALRPFSSNFCTVSMLFQSA